MRNRVRCGQAFDAQAVEWSKFRRRRAPIAPCKVGTKEMFQLLSCPAVTDGGRVGSGKQPAAGRRAFQAAAVHPLGHLGQGSRRADRVAEQLVIVLKGVDPRLFIHIQSSSSASTS